MMEKIKSYWTIGLVAVVALLVGFAASSLWSGGLKSKMLSSETRVTGADKNTSPSEVSTNFAMPKENVMSAASSGDTFVVADQPAGNSVVVSKVTLEKAAWVVVHEDRDGAPGNILGALWLPAGTATQASVELLRDTQAGKAYYVMIHEDTLSDKQFDHAQDLPLKDASGAVIMMKFKTTSGAI